MIDWSRVAQLREEIGEEDFAEVVVLFLDEVEGLLAGLQPGATDLGAQLHLLRGSALNLGFAGLAALCETGEQAAEAGRAGTVDLGALRDSFARSRDDFAQRLERRRAG